MVLVFPSDFLLILLVYLSNKVKVVHLNADDNENKEDEEKGITAGEGRKLLEKGEYKSDSEDDGLIYHD